MCNIRTESKEWTGEIAEYLFINKNNPEYTHKNLSA